MLFSSFLFFNFYSNVILTPLHSFPLLAAPYSIVFFRNVYSVLKLAYRFRWFHSQQILIEEFDLN